MNVTGSSDSNAFVPTPFGEQTVFEVVPGIETARHIDGLTLRLSETGVYFSLNETAIFIWERLNEKKSLAEVKQAVLEQFAPPPQESEAAIHAFVGGLIKEGLLRIPDH